MLSCTAIFFSQGYSLYFFLILVIFGWLGVWVFGVGVLYWVFGAAVPCGQGSYIQLKTEFVTVYIMRVESFVMVMG